MTECHQHVTNISPTFETLFKIFISILDDTKNDVVSASVNDMEVKTLKHKLGYVCISHRCFNNWCESYLQQKKWHQNWHCYSHQNRDQEVIPCLFCTSTITITIIILQKSTLRSSSGKAVGLPLPPLAPPRTQMGTNIIQPMKFCFNAKVWMAMKGVMMIH